MSLEELIDQCKRRDRKAQEQLYRLFCNKLYSLCLKYSRNEAQAQDNLQDSFVTIFNKIDQYSYKGSFEGWLKRITINTSLQKYRSDGVFDIINEVPDENESIEVEDNDISLDYLLSIIQELPDRYRITFSLYVLDGYSHKEISSMLKITEGTSKSNLARARASLKERIELDHLKKKVN
ncbi:RNA polymerase sigma-70 factor, ECF subfamily [Zhouia amylolytica]|uniref:RNA polymerase sigma factor, sigma-70 family n=2 Tax=Zhouia amylolytica TaxID=376730 RepID=W2UJE3_9FLAO|nr:RNA polymerase sigma factor [Zhouia amylolytica]ETN94133.1 RNA polymerase sigma factor, sigma-70 family [Zhouia amylolytica AD3]MCQ0112358.1 RNA polymerase sigma factor [Zhouia amylolytica]SFS41370.1 RNA polymerase sigma-70 factor, ECF subfamily [Zhouia amylolytica]